MRGVRDQWISGWAWSGSAPACSCWPCAARRRAQRQAEGRDEVFWLGLGEACEGFRWLLAGEADRAEQHLIAGMHNLRNFGYAYGGFQITVLLAGLRRCAEEIRLVRQQPKGIIRRFQRPVGLRYRNMPLHQHGHPFSQ